LIDANFEKMAQFLNCKPRKPCRLVQETVQSIDFRGRALEIWLRAAIPVVAIPVAAIITAIIPAANMYGYSGRKP
jgi:hypothetical protein